MGQSQKVIWVEFSTLSYTVLLYYIGGPGSMCSAFAIVAKEQVWNKLREVQNSLNVIKV